MKELKDGIRSIVRVGYDDRVHKTFRGTDKKERYINEVKILTLLHKRGCTYVPELLDSFDDEYKIITTNCGQPLNKLSEEKQKSLFSDLKDSFGVLHDDQNVRNITYSHKLNKFCIIDFELSKDLWDGSVKKPE